jgi:hypothetical protein
MGDGNRYDILPVIPMRYNRERYNGGTYNRTGVFHEVTVDPATAIATPAVDPLHWTITLPVASEFTFGFGMIEPLAGERVISKEGVTGIVVSVAVTSGSWAAGDAAGTIVLQDVSGVFSVTGSDCLRVEGKGEIDFDHGSVAFTVGQTVTDADSGMTARILAVFVASGSWAGGDAAGSLIVDTIYEVTTLGDALTDPLGGHALAKYDNDPYLWWGPSLTALVVDGGVCAAVGTPEETIAWDMEAFPDATRLYLTCFVEPVAGDVLYGLDSGATATVVSYVLLEGAFIQGDAKCLIYTGGVTGAFDDNESVGITGKTLLWFNNGDVAFVVGDVVTGADSGCSATVLTVNVLAGAWGTGDAQGSLVVTGASGTPEHREVLNGTGGGHALCANDNFDTWIGTFGAVSSNTVTLPAVMYWQDIDWHIEVPAATAIATPSQSLAWGINPAAVTAYARPGIPTVNIFTPPPTATNSLLTGCTASMNMSDKMMMAQFDYVNSTTGDIPNTYFKWVELWIPDYAGVQQLVFRGFFPSGKATLAAEGDHEVLTAYDPSWYLTVNTPSADDKVLLTPDAQSANKTYMIWYNNIWPNFFNVGDSVYGQTSGSYGIVTEDAFADGHRHLLILNPLVEYGGHFFADGETLLVNGVATGTADGYAVDVTGIVTVINPDTYITRLLGGDDYDRITGVYPYRITPLTAWSSTSNPVAIEFDCAEKETKMQIIERICKYLHYIFAVRPITIGSTAYTAAYFIPEANIDLPAPMGLDLPAAVTIGATDAYLLSPATHERKGDEKYNQVRVRCQCAFGPHVGKWFECVLPTGGYRGGDPIIEYYEINPSLNSQAEADARCADIYNYYSVQIESYEVTFTMRSDLRILQKLVFSAGGKIAAGTYRIVAIKFDYRDAGCTNDQTCTIIPDTQFKFYLNLNRVFTDSITEIQNIVKNEMDKLGTDELAEVTAVDPTNGTMTVKTESGEVRTIRNPT